MAENGNAVALRGALEYAREVLALNGFVEPVIRCDAALSIPPRQCDVGTPEEQSERFKKFCFDHQAPWHGCTNCPVLMSEKCALTWAQMPYTEEKEASR